MMSDQAQNPLTQVLTYLYYLQDFEKIKPDLNESNIVHLFALAYAMKMPTLLDDIEKYVTTEIITEDNAPSFYLVGIRFKNECIIETCETLITDNFDKYTSEGSGKIPNFLKRIPFDRLKSLLSKDSLKVTKEKFVIDLIEAYLQHRDALPVLEDEDPMNDWTILNAEEREKREEDQKAQ